MNPSTPNSIRFEYHLLEIIKSDKALSDLFSKELARETLDFSELERIVGCARARDQEAAKRKVVHAIENQLPSAEASLREVAIQNTLDAYSDLIAFQGMRKIEVRPPYKIEVDYARPEEEGDDEASKRKSRRKDVYDVSIRDYAIGMDLQTILYRLLAVGDTTKKGKASQVGGHGRGFKPSIVHSDMVMIESNRNLVVVDKEKAMTKRGMETDYYITIVDRASDITQGTSVLLKNFRINRNPGDEVRGYASKISSIYDFRINDAPANIRTPLSHLGKLKFKEEYALPGSKGTIESIVVACAPDAACVEVFKGPMPLMQTPPEEKFTRRTITLPADAMQDRSRTDLPDDVKRVLDEQRPRAYQRFYKFLRNNLANIGSHEFRFMDYFNYVSGVWDRIGNKVIYQAKICGYIFLAGILAAVLSNEVVRPATEVVSRWWASFSTYNYEITEAHKVFVPQFDTEEAKRYNFERVFSMFNRTPKLSVLMEEKAVGYCRKCPDGSLFSLITYNKLEGDGSWSIGKKEGKREKCLSPDIKSGALFNSRDVVLNMKLMEDMLVPQMSGFPIYEFISPKYTDTSSNICGSEMLEYDRMRIKPNVQDDEERNLLICNLKEGISTLAELEEALDKKDKTKAEKRRKELSYYFDVPFEISYPKDLEDMLKVVDNFAAEQYRYQWYTALYVKYAFEQHFSRQNKKENAKKNRRHGESLASFTLRAGTLESGSLDHTFASVLRQRYGIPTRLKLGLRVKEGEIWLGAVDTVVEAYIPDKGWVPFSVYEKSDMSISNSFKEEEERQKIKQENEKIDARMKKSLEELKNSKLESKPEIKDDKPVNNPQTSNETPKPSNITDKIKQATGERRDTFYARGTTYKPTALSIPFYIIDGEEIAADDSTDETIDRMLNSRAFGAYDKSLGNIFFKFMDYKVLNPDGTWDAKPANASVCLERNIEKGHGKVVKVKMALNMAQPVPLPMPIGYNRAAVISPRQVTLSSNNCISNQFSEDATMTSACTDPECGMLELNIQKARVTVNELEDAMSLKTTKAAKAKRAAAMAEVGFYFDVPFQIEYPSELEQKLKRVDEYAKRRPENRNEIAGKVESALKSYFIYSATPEQVKQFEAYGNTVNAALKYRTVVCQSANSALAAVLRQRYGIATRFSTGITGENGRLINRPRNLHAVVEAYIPGKGWREYDATPSTTNPAVFRKATEEEKKLHQQGSKDYSNKGMKLSIDISDDHNGKYKSVGSGYSTLGSGTSAAEYEKKKAEEEKKKEDEAKAAKIKAAEEEKKKADEAKAVKALEEQKKAEEAKKKAANVDNNVGSATTDTKPKTLEDKIEDKINDRIEGKTTTADSKTTAGKPGADKPETAGEIKEDKEKVEEKEEGWFSKVKYGLFGSFATLLAGAAAYFIYRRKQNNLATVRCIDVYVKENGETTEQRINLNEGIEYLVSERLYFDLNVSEKGLECLADERYKEGIYVREYTFYEIVLDKVGKRMRIASAVKPKEDKSKKAEEPYAPAPEAVAGYEQKDATTTSQITARLQTEEIQIVKEELDRAVQDEDGQKDPSLEEVAAQFGETVVRDENIVTDEDESRASRRLSIAEMYRSACEKLRKAGSSARKKASDMKKGIKNYVVDSYERARSALSYTEIMERRRNAKIRAIPRIAATSEHDNPYAYLGPGNMLLDGKYDHAVITKNSRVIGSMQELADIVCESNNLHKVHVKGDYKFLADYKMFAYEHSRFGKPSVHVNLENETLRTNAAQPELEPRIVDAMIQAVMLTRNISLSDFNKIKARALDSIYLRNK